MRIISRVIKSIFVLLFLLVPGISRSQEVILTEKGDTLIAITPEQVRTINIMFKDHRLLEEKVQIQSERIDLQERRIEVADSLIADYNLLVNGLEQQMVLREKAYENLNRKSKKKAFIAGGISGIIVGALVTFLICR